MKVSRMQRLSMYVGLALVFGSTLSAPNVLAVEAGDANRKSTRLNSSHSAKSRMPSSA